MIDRLSILVLVLSAAACSAQAGETIEQLRLPTVDGRPMTIIDGESNPRVSPGGIAVDAAGRIYLSDRGAPDAGNGRIFLLDGTNTAIEVANGLERPGDIEMTPDQRGLVVAQPGGGIAVHWLGVTVRFTGSLAERPALRPILKSPWGALVAERRADGYYHFPEVLRPAATNATATLVVTGLDPPRAMEVPLLDPGTGEARGEVVVDMELNP